MSDIDGMYFRAARSSDDQAFRRCLLSEASLEWVLANEEFLIDEWGREGDVGLLREVDAEVIGAAWVRQFVDADADLGFLSASTPVLVNAWVQPSHRGHGLGSALLRELLAICRSNGNVAVSLATDPDNPAVRLYRRLGFEMNVVVGARWLMVKDLTRSAT